MLVSSFVLSVLLMYVADFITKDIQKFYKSFKAYVAQEM